MTNEDRRRGSARRAAIVLAAGASSRYGGLPKATLDVDGEPAVRRLVRISSEEGFVPLVVAGAHTPAIRAAAGERATVIDHPDWSLGRTSSLQAGLAAVGDVDLLAIWPVDHPFAEALSLRRVLRAAEDDALALWVVPTYSGRGGHPIVLKSPTFAALRALGPDAPLRSLQAQLGPQVRRVPVEDPGVVANIDTPEAYERAIAARREARWTGG
jgi:molybdenum cofactor cytidylyltransferase